MAISGGKFWLGMALLALGAVGMARLGLWQVSRAEEKRDLAAVVQAGRAQPAIALGAATQAAELRPYRKARATGRWLADRTVLLDNRMASGRPGFWVVTPLAIEGGGTVAVMRGWVARPMPDGPVAIATPAGRVDVSGELLARVPRLFELASLGAGAASALPARLPDASGMPPRVQNLELADYARAAGAELLPALIAQGGKGADGLLREWPQPPVNVTMHYGYAMQWFIFAAIAAIACGVLIVRRLRR